MFVGVGLVPTREPKPQQSSFPTAIQSSETTPFQGEMGLYYTVKAKISLKKKPNFISRSNSKKLLYFNPISVGDPSRRDCNGGCEATGGEGS
jgi:hypothetical protein